MLVFVIIAIPAWFFCENFFKVLVTFILDLNDGQGRSLRNTTLKIFLGISGFFLLVYFVLIIVFVVIVIWKSKTKSRLAHITKGLNQKSKWFVFLYYFHYFGIRLLIAFLIFLSKYVESFYLWLLLSLFQLLIVILHAIKLYDGFINYILVFIWEVQILFVIATLTVLHKFDSKSEVQ